MATTVLFIIFIILTYTKLGAIPALAALVSSVIAFIAKRHGMSPYTRALRRACAEIGREDYDDIGEKLKNADTAFGFYHTADIVCVLRSLNINISLNKVRQSKD